MEARATLALKPGVWFRRGRLLMVSPDSLGTACPLSGRNSTYRLVQILEAGSGTASPAAGPIIPNASSGNVHDARLMDRLIRDDDTAVYGDKGYASGAKKRAAEAAGVLWAVKEKAKPGGRLTA